MSVNQFLLYEDASGYSLFKKQEGEEIGQDTEQVAAAISNYETFRSMVELVAFHRFGSAEEALAECNAIAGGEVSSTLENFLEMNLPKAKKKSTYQLGVMDAAGLGQALNQKFSVNCDKGVKELLRGCLMHFPHFAKDISEEDLNRARCGLAHCFSRAKMQDDPNRQDKPIMNTIAILDNLDKNINTFAMRVKEWYAWHFPELAKIVNDNIVYAKVARCLRIRDTFDEARLPELAEICGSEEVAKEVSAAMKISMGQDIVEMDMANIDNFALQVVELANMRQLLTEYLRRKMDIVAPNLGSLIGEHVGARLISHAGSLTNLAKYPASTVQILGAEKALFRALKTKGNTPKYGLLYHSTFIGRAQQKNKGRISRYLANKCSIASRIDCFSDHSTKLYGERMRDQVEERLNFLTEGVKPRKNLDVMREALEAVTEEIRELAKSQGKKTSKKAVDAAETSNKRSAEENAAESEEKPKKKKKKSKDDVAVEEAPVVEAVEEGKKKKKNKSAEEAPAAEPVAASDEKKKKKKKDK